MDDQTNLITLAVVHAVKSGLENVDLSLDEAIQMTFEYLKSINYWSGMPQMMQQSHKSAAKATELRTRGNLAFQDGRSEAFKHYSESVAVAPAGSQELAFAYGNRSTAAFRIGQQKHIECLVDINRAFQENYPEAGKQKLIDRKEKCVEFYQRTIKTYVSLRAIYENLKIFFFHWKFHALQMCRGEMSNEDQKKQNGVTQWQGERKGSIRARTKLQFITWFEKNIISSLLSHHLLLPPPPASCLQIRF